MKWALVIIGGLVVTWKVKSSPVVPLAASVKPRQAIQVHALMNHIPPPAASGKVSKASNPPPPLPAKAPPAPASYVYTPSFDPRFLSGAAARSIQDSAGKSAEAGVVALGKLIESTIGTGPGFKENQNLTGIGGPGTIAADFSYFDGADLMGNFNGASSDGFDFGAGGL